MWFSASAQALTEKFGEPEQGITHLARRLLARANVQGPPFFPDEFAPFCSVRQIRNRRIPGHGLLVRRPDGFAIYINRKYAWHDPQWNAVCAHELGHVLLSQVSPRALDAQNEWVDEDEQLANRAARELLLPEQEFQRLAADGAERSDALQLMPRNDKDAPLVMLQQVADIFRAPLRMTAQRFVETGVWRDLILAWDVEGDELLLKSWWPAHHPGSCFLRRHARAIALFGPENAVQKAVHRDTIVRDLEAISPQRGVIWLVQSAAFTEYRKKYVLSFVRTGDAHDGLLLI